MYVQNKNKIYIQKRLRKHVLNLTRVLATENTDNSKIDQINYILSFSWNKKRRNRWICRLISYLIYTMNTFKVNIKDQCHSDLLMTEITIHIALSFILFLFIWTCACLMYYSCKSSHLENSYELSDLRRDHSFSTYGKCSEKLTFLTP